jgi:DNA modification methylase
MKPGTLFCCHIQQLYTTKVQHGFMGVRDFRGSVITLARNCGFEHQGEVAIPKDPVALVNRSQKHSLQWITGYARNARDLAPAANDFLLIFRKPGEGKPIQSLYHPEKNPQGWVSLLEWQKIACGTWDDIHEIDVLDGYKSARESDEERHVCPLQLEVIRRCILLYSAPGETVLDPFMGIGSTAYVALEQGRNAVGFELKESYYEQSLRNIEKARREWAKAKEPDLFTALEAGGSRRQ